MARFYGAVGFVTIQETAPSVYVEVPVERVYAGDVLQFGRNLESSGKVNGDIQTTNKISLVGDPFINENVHYIRYVIWMGTRWNVSSISVEMPRLVLTLGGIYNGPTPTAG